MGERYAENVKNVKNDVIKLKKINKFGIMDKWSLARSGRLGISDWLCCLAQGG